MQFHGGVYRSDDAGESWTDIGDGLPSDFGFPLVVDPADPDSAYVIPLKADMDRVTPEGRVRVYETRDAGATWTARGDGLPAEHAYLTVLRLAFDRAGEGDALELYFGATSGDVFGSAGRRRDLVLSGDPPAAGLLGPRRAERRARRALDGDGADRARSAPTPPPSSPSALVAVDDHPQAPAEVARGRRRSAASVACGCRATCAPDWRCHWYA